MGSLLSLSATSLGVRPGSYLEIGSRTAAIARLCEYITNLCTIERGVCVLDAKKKKNCQRWFWGDYCCSQTSLPRFFIHMIHHDFLKEDVVVFLDVGWGHLMMLFFNWWHFQRYSILLALSVVFPVILYYRTHTNIRDKRWWPHALGMIFTLNPFFSYMNRRRGEKDPFLVYV